MIYFRNFYSIQKVHFPWTKKQNRMRFSKLTVNRVNHLKLSLRPSERVIQWGSPRRSHSRESFKRMVIQRSHSEVDHLDGVIQEVIQWGSPRKSHSRGSLHADYKITKNLWLFLSVCDSGSRTGVASLLNSVFP